MLSGDTTFEDRLVFTYACGADLNNTNHAIRLVNSVYDRNKYIFKITVCTDSSYIRSTRARTHTELTKQATYEYHSPFRGIPVENLAI